MNITNLTLIETIEALKKGEFTETELNDAYQKRIEELNPKLNAYLQVTPNQTGIPVGVKDIISTKGIKTTAGSKILENYTPPYNAMIIDNLLNPNTSGVTTNINGKLNNDEFAMGSSGENSAYGPTKNPWDTNKVPGGSSSGSAAAVAADLCVFALGTDTGGSIRQPASFCGVVGLKPSYGRLSRYGLISMASSLDCPGVLTKSVADARLALEWLSGDKNLDNNAVQEKYTSSKIAELKGVKVGVPKEYFAEGLDSKVKQTIEQAIKKLEELGATTVEVSLPNTKYAIATYYILMASEVSSNLARFDGIRFGGPRELFGPEPKRRIMLGAYSLSSGYYDAYYTQAAKVRTLIKQDFEKAFESCDVIVGPVSPTVAWNIGEKVSDPLAMYLMDAYTIPASLAGIPGLSVPCGFADEMPVGLQILGKYMDEDTVLSVGELYENATQWRKEKPTIK